MTACRGDIFRVSLDPVMGHEQAGRRPVLVISHDSFNRFIKIPIVLPITNHGNFARRRGFSVDLTGCGLRTKGIVRCDQPRAIDLEARNGEFVERLPDAMVEDVLARVRTIFDSD